MRYCLYIYGVRVYTCDTANHTDAPSPRHIQCKKTTLNVRFVGTMPKCSLPSSLSSAAALRSNGGARALESVMRLSFAAAVDWVDNARSSCRRCKRLQNIGVVNNRSKSHAGDFRPWRPVDAQSF